MDENHLIQILHVWDPKSTQDLETFYKNNGSSDQFIQFLFPLFGKEPKFDDGITWLIKKKVETTKLISHEDSKVLIDVSKKFSSWPAQLHFLQIIDYMNVSRNEAVDLIEQIKSNLSHKNKFIRAWTYNGLFVLSNKHNISVNDIQKLLQFALNNEAPSVKARIRNLLKD